MSELRDGRVLPSFDTCGLSSLRGKLLNEPPLLPLQPTRGDYDLNPSMRLTATGQLRPAAVLMPIIARREPSVLFTQRTAHLTQHAGQISFPGGRVEEHDISMVQTALRETQEETGIDPAFVSVAGFLDPYETGTGYAILPVVGLLSEGFSLNPHAGEVAEIFEVPLDFLLDPKNREKGMVEYKGGMRQYYVFNYEVRRIWGATAGMLVNFVDRLAL